MTACGAGIAAFAELVETLASDLDAGSYLGSICQHCVRLIGAQGAAIVYAASQGRADLRMAASDEVSGKLASECLASGAGLWAECLATGMLITISDLRAEPDRWPDFTSRATAAGMTTVTAVPIGGHGEVVGALVLLGGTVPDIAGMHLARSLADAAGSGITLSNELRRQEVAITQLQSALKSRIVIEQAKGILAERWKVEPDEAFEQLRRHARATRRRLPDVAIAVINGASDVAAPDTLPDEMS